MEDEYYFRHEFDRLLNFFFTSSFSFATLNETKWKSVICEIKILNLRMVTVQFTLSMQAYFWRDSAQYLHTQPSKQYQLVSTLEPPT